MTQLMDSRPELVDDLTLTAVRSTSPQRASRAPAIVQRPLAIARGIPDLGIYLGVVLLVVGFTLIAVAWHDVAQRVVVSLQLPYLASGAFTGLGLVICGVALIAITVKAKDTAAKRAQTLELIATQRQIRAALERAAERAS